MNLIVVFCLSFLSLAHAYRALHPTGPPSVDDDADVFNYASRSASSGVIRSSGSHSKHFRKNLAKCVEHPFPKAFLRPSAAHFARAAFSRGRHLDGDENVLIRVIWSLFLVSSDGMAVGVVVEDGILARVIRTTSEKEAAFDAFFVFIGVVGTTRERETRPWSFLLLLFFVERVSLHVTDPFFISSSHLSLYRNALDGAPNVSFASSSCSVSSVPGHIGEPRLSSAKTHANDHMSMD